MEDIQIVNLYWSRDERALSETKIKYDSLLKRISYNILASYEDSEEVVSDTYEKAWTSMPEQRPSMLSAYLGKIVRNLSINVWHKKHAEKRWNGVDVILSELEYCIPDKTDTEQTFDDKELTSLLNNWLESLSAVNRAIFIRRYWYGDSVNSLAKECQVLPKTMACKLFRLRNSLKAVLIKEGISI